jgi:hypothetical protein
LPNDISGQISGLPEGLVSQVGVTLGHGRAFVRQELLQGVKIYLAGGCQHRGEDVAQAMEGPEVFGEARRLFDLPNLVIDIHPFPTPATGKDVRAIGSGMGL